MPGGDDLRCLSDLAGYAVLLGEHLRPRRRGARFLQAQVTQVRVRPAGLDIVAAARADDEIEVDQPFVGDDRPGETGRLARQLTMQIGEVCDLRIETGQAVGHFSSPGAGCQQCLAQFLHAGYLAGVGADLAAPPDNLLKVGLAGGELLLQDADVSERRVGQELRSDGGVLFQGCELEFDGPQPGVQ